MSIYDQIMRGLNPGDPASIQALIDFHRSTLGGYRMAEGSDAGGQADTAGTAGDKPAGSSGQANGQPDADKLGEGGIKALAAERDARKALEKQLADLKTSQDAQTKALAEAFGIKTDAKSGETDVLTTLQQQMQALQHDNLVLRVAGESKITDPTDRALLAKLSSEEDMRNLAARLASPAGAGTGTPKPDRSAGSGAGTPDKGSVQAGADMFADRRKSTTTKE